jgi:hypothetical protein
VLHQFILNLADGRLTQAQFAQVSEQNGGSDETRTRDLLRDRQAF